MSISEKIVYLKNRKKLSTEALSQASGVPIGTLNKLLTGETKKPTGRTAHKIASVFGVRAEYLLDDSIPIEAKEKLVTEIGDELSPSKAALLQAAREMDDATAQAVLEIVKQVKRLRGQE